ncbi:MAG: DUF3347 domain-containing protein [Chitinophagaceae bacterium]
MKSKIILFATLATLQMVSLNSFAKERKVGTTNFFHAIKNPADLAFAQYVLIQKALAGENALMARKTAGDLVAALKKIPGSAPAIKAASSISMTENIQDQRKAFSTLSNAITALFKHHKPEGEMIYIHYCPMVKAYWLSNAQSIQNPYLGKSMPTCGKTTGMIM